MGRSRSQEAEARVKESLRRTFKPEFLNRIDEIIFFHSLDPDQIGEIVEIQVERLRKRLQDRQIDLVLSAEARDLIAEKGYDPVYGARPLKRALQKYIENPLSMEILKGAVPDGSTVEATVRGGEVAFSLMEEKARISP
jgi:ATP-dependent Clp protease ATP-binding subunit ClpB